MEEYSSNDIQTIKQALLNFNQDNFKENSIKFLTIKVLISQFFFAIWINRDLRL